MAGEVIHLAFSSPNAPVSGNSMMIACVHCKNKTYKLIHFMNDFPLLQCAACDAHIGRMGWVPDNGR